MVSELLPIQSVNNVDVVDSRLIAIELGIQHESFVKTIKTYQTRLEKRGVLRFEIDKPLKGSSGGRPETFYWLNERQCIFLTTLSRNTDQVVELKDKIEESFYHAKKLITQQQDTIKELTLKLALANAEKERAMAEKNLLDTRQYIATALPEPMQQKILGYQVVEKVVEKTVVYKEEEFLRDSSTINKTKLCNRYGILTKNGKPDYPRLNKILSTVDLPAMAWKKIKEVRENVELKSEYIELLDGAIVQDSRQLWIGE
jgi:phage regulator Rha-like protein